jgi:SAM-dependent methyltransferase
MKKDPMVDKTYYEQTDLWNKPPQAYQSRVRTDLLHVIPGDVESVLDVGCGNGYITNAFPITIFVVGTDISSEALQYVERPHIINSMTHLPFSDGSFDLVQAIDVIEHISDEGYRQALKELERVAKKYLVISVPFMENLKAGFTRCSACGLIYHINHHYRSFGIIELTDLFKNDWKPTVFVFSGEDVSLNEIYFRTIRSFLGVLTEWSMAICPCCNSKGSTKEVDNGDKHAIASLAEHIPRTYGILHPDRSECVVLYEKRQLPTQTIDSREILQLTINGYREQIPVPTRTTYHERCLVVEAPVDRCCDLSDALWLVWKLPGRVYCYPNPRSFGVNRFFVPTWFTRSNVESLSSSRVLWNGDEGIKLVLSGIQEMQREIYQRRGLKGAIRTILERFGIKSLK